MSACKHFNAWIQLVACGLLLSAVLGCVGVAAGPGYVGVDTYVPSPDVFVFGGYGRGHVDRDFGRRGAVSRSVGHVGGGRSHR
jgi:hypothetical protein